MLIKYQFRFREEVDIYLRLEAIGQIIQENDYPHFICLQVSLGST